MAIGRNAAKAFAAGYGNLSVHINTGLIRHSCDAQEAGAGVSCFVLVASGGKCCIAGGVNLREAAVQIAGV